MRKGVLYSLGLVVAILAGLGLVVLFSASQVRGDRFYHDPYWFVKRQTIYMAMGIVIAVCAALFDYRKWRDNPALAIAFGVAVFLCLLWVFRFDAVKGSHRWVSLGAFSFQPGEFAKLATVLCVSTYLDLAAWRVELFVRGAICPAAIMAVFALPVVFEPDFGSVMVIASVAFMLMFIAGTRLLHIVPLGILGLGLVGWKIFHNANRMARIAAFMGSSRAVADAAAAAGASASAASGAEFQSDMSLVAIGRGGIFGVGLSNSMQKQNFLPEAWTDFIFAVGAEEMGLVFSIAAVLLFTAFFILSLHVAMKATDRFGRFLVAGMAFVIFFQAMFNIGVVCEAFPTKGMALPFFSYGGTNMLGVFFAVGVIFSVGIHSIKDSRRTFPGKIVAN